MREREEVQEVLQVGSYSMKDHPILFSGPMVRAILEGRKTTTRRVVKPEPKRSLVRGLLKLLNWSDGDSLYKCPYGIPGDRLWVRETWNNDGCACYDTCRCPQVIYRADGEYDAQGHDDPPKWKPSIFMPRWASRITLEVVNIRVERVQEISEKDARSEGYPVKPDPSTLTEAGMRLMPPLVWFNCLWDSINADRGYGWSKNPWVWVIEFKRVLQPEGQKGQ